MKLEDHIVKKRDDVIQLKKSCLIRGIERETYSLIYGSPNTGKSNILYQLSYCLSNGIDFLDLIEHDKKHKVAILSAEDSQNKISNKISIYEEKYNLQDDNDNLTIFSLSGISDYKLINIDGSTNDKSLIEFIKYFEQNELIIFDTIIKFVDYNDNNIYKNINKFNELMMTCASKYNCTIIGIHHTNSAGTLEGANIVGKSPRTILKIEKLKSIDKDTLQSRFIWEKINDSVMTSIEHYYKEDEGLYYFDYTLERQTGFISNELDTNISLNKFSRLFFGDSNSEIKDYGNQVVKLDNRFTSVEMFKNVQDGTKLDKATYKVQSNDGLRTVKVNMLDQLTHFDSEVYFTILGLMHNLKNGTIINHEESKNIYGELYNSKISINKDDKSGQILSINLQTDMITLIKAMGKHTSKKYYKNVFESLERLMNTNYIFSEINSDKNQEIIYNGQFIFAKIWKNIDDVSGDTKISITLNPLSAQVFLPSMNVKNTPYLKLNTSVTQSLGDASSVYYYLMKETGISKGEVIPVNILDMTRFIYPKTDDKKIEQKRKERIRNYIQKIIETIPDILNIQYKGSSNATILVHRKQ